MFFDRLAFGEPRRERSGAGEKAIGARTAVYRGESEGSDHDFCNFVRSKSQPLGNTRFGIWGPLALTVALQGIWDLLYAPWTYNTIQVYVCLALLFCAVHFRPQQSGP